MSSAQKFSHQNDPKTRLGSVMGMKGQESGTELPRTRALPRALTSEVPTGSVMDGDVAQEQGFFALGCSW